VDQFGGGCAHCVAQFSEAVTVARGTLRIETLFGRLYGISRRGVEIPFRRGRHTTSPSSSHFDPESTEYVSILKGICFSQATRRPTRTLRTQHMPPPRSPRPTAQHGEDLLDFLCSSIPSLPLRRFGVLLVRVLWPTVNILFDSDSLDQVWRIPSSLVLSGHMKEVR
jgi:hypothetical protein